ncbi:hypothetical protein GALMADRAFT_216854 [Galerina marginata CBS 339.88]|uniref:Uncharacterized protein n=1 Tax=Galerina marginata (strain CBS 339.88) TaxID=685588 RepID=A0A067SGH2_GALM3|nr:hypothetical protein GALMADRAFT_216854 [Galerina marginata CBS 339.88]
MPERNLTSKIPPWCEQTQPGARVRKTIPNPCRRLNVSTPMSTSATPAGADVVVANQCVLESDTPTEEFVEDEAWTSVVCVLGNKVHNEVYWSLEKDSGEKSEISPDLERSGGVHYLRLIESSTRGVRV